MITSNTNGARNSPYEIGKVLGLEGKKTSIADYKEMLSSITGAFKETVDTAFKTINDHYREMAHAYPALRKELEEEDKKYYENTRVLLDHLKELLLMAEINQKDIPDIIKDFKERAVKRFDNNNLIVAAAKEALEKKILAVDTQLAAGIEKLERGHNSFIEGLKSKNVDVVDYEQGFLDGSSLKAALSTK